RLALRLNLASAVYSRVPTTHHQPQPTRHSGHFPDAPWAPRAASETARVDTLGHRCRLPSSARWPIARSTFEPPPPFDLAGGWAARSPRCPHHGIAVAAGSPLLTASIENNRAYFVRAAAPARYHPRLAEVGDASGTAPGSQRQPGVVLL